MSSIPKYLCLIVSGTGKHALPYEKRNIENIEYSVSYHSPMVDIVTIKHTEFNEQTFGTGYDGVILIYSGYLDRSPKSGYPLLPTASGRNIDSYEFWRSSCSRFKFLKVIMSCCNTIYIEGSESVLEEAGVRRFDFFKDQRSLYISATGVGSVGYGGPNLGSLFIRDFFHMWQFIHNWDTILDKRILEDAPIDPEQVPLMIIYSEDVNNRLSTYLKIPIYAAFLYSFIG